MDNELYNSFLNKNKVYNNKGSLNYFGNNFNYENVFNPLEQSFKEFSLNTKALKNLYGYEQRNPYAGELEYFKNNPTVSGMATEDNRIILNPYSNLSDAQKEVVARNEAIRLYLRNNNIQTNFGVTPEQQSFFAGSEYSKPENLLNLQHTILARILTNDKSIGNITNEQKQAAKQLMKKLNR